MPNTDERFLWAHECLEINPSEHILEIGCGTGILAELIAPDLTTGKLVAIDKSNSLIKKAAERLGSLSNADRVQLYTKDLCEAGDLKMRFDKIAAFNVNIFWNGSPEHFAVIKKLTDTKSIFFIFYDSPSGDTSNIIKKIESKIQKEGMYILDSFSKKFQKGAACCVKARFKA